MGNIPSTMMSNAMIIIKYALLFIFIYVYFLLGLTTCPNINPKLTRVDSPTHLIRFVENTPFSSGVVSINQRTHVRT